MRRSALILTAALSACICSCDGNVRQDESPVSICIPRSVGKEFMQILADGVKDGYGIDVEFVDMYSADRTSQVAYNLDHGIMPADIVFCDSRNDDRTLEPICLDLLSYSHIVDRFNYEAIKKRSVKGAIYQLPISSKLIGITYNATLMEEHGWTVPSSMADMIDLKRKCDAAGVKFALTDVRYTGNGFNYLFNLMGSQWISTIEGAGWYDAFLSGTATSGPFKEKSSYFAEWVENGLFGELIASVPEPAYAAQRALFLYTSTNKDNLAGGDVYKSMPWISEGSSNNCYTRYDNCWVMADKKLLAPDKRNKLDKVCKILDYISDVEFVDAVKSLYTDNYVMLNGFVPGENQIYYNFYSQIKSGYVQPWYYKDFKPSAVVNTGAQINSYLLKHYFRGDVPESVTNGCYYEYDPEAGFDSIFKTLEESELGTDMAGDVVCTITKDFDYEQTAKVSAIAGALSLQEKLSEQAPDAPEVRVALMPYVKSLGDYCPWIHIGVSNARLLSGPFHDAVIRMLIPDPAHDVRAVRLTGAQIRELVAGKFDPSGYFVNRETGVSSFDSEHYGPYPYTVVTKGGINLVDDEEYIVSVAPKSLAPDVWKSYVDSGKVVTSSETGKIVSAGIQSGLPMFFEKHQTLGPDDIVW